MSLSHHWICLLLISGTISIANPVFAKGNLPEKADLNPKQDMRSGFHFNVEPGFNVPHTLESELDEPFLAAAKKHDETARSVAAIHNLYARSIKNAWNAENFTTLENLLHQFKVKIMPTIIGGEATEPLFYREIASASIETEASNPDFSMTEKIERWRTAYPNSLAPDLALAKYYIDKAYQARGTEYASKTPQANAETFHYISLQALRVLLNARDHGKQLDPEFYAMLITVLQALPFPEEQIQESFQAGIKLDSSYRPLYDAMATISMPRWYGDTDDLASLAHYYSASHPTYHNTDGLYVRVVEDVLWGIQKTPEEMLSYGFSWPIIKSGYINDAKFEGIPTWRLDMFRWLAVLYDDKATAKTLFDILQNTRYRAIWGEDEIQFNKAKDWAAGKEAHNPLHPALKNQTSKIAYQ